MTYINGSHFIRKSVVRPTKRFKYIFLIGILTSTSLSLIVIKLFINNESIPTFHTYSSAKLKKGFNLNLNSEELRSIIKTNGCTIPSMNPWDKSIQKFIHFPKEIPRCLKKESLVLDHNKTHIWIKKYILALQQDNIYITCCYRAFYRPTFIDDINSKVDNRVTYHQCINFKEEIKIQDEFVKVNCTIFNISVEQYFLTAQNKEWKAREGYNDIEKLKNTSYNVLILGVDSVSRLNFFRTMPKTLRFLQEHDAVDLSGYNKVGDNTFPNLVPMLLGITDSEIRSTCLPYNTAKFDNCPFIWEWFKQAGYYTALVEDSSWLGTFNYLRAGFINTPTDYYTHTFLNEAEKHASKKNGFNLSQLCLNEKYFYQILLDYVEDITNTLKNSKLFGFFWETTMSHDYVNYPMAMDDDYHNLFQKLNSSRYLENTFIFFISDHGIRWGNIRYTKQGRIEERLPFAFILAPPSFRKKYSLAHENLILNSKRLTTPFDIYATLSDLINVEKLENYNTQRRSEQQYFMNRSISLFLPVPSNRTCELAGISDHWCTCLQSVEILTTNRKVISAALYLIWHLNYLLSRYEECANLKLEEVIEASELLEGKPEHKENVSWREFMLVVKTSPGDGIFEATLRGRRHKWSVLGTVSRLNLYGTQGSCINSNQLKLYCYCKSYK